MKIDIADLEKKSSPEELFSILTAMMSHLRSPEGCMWDREQTHDSIKRNLIEEAYEGLEAIEVKDYESLKEELGDILLQVVFHSQIAEENNTFNLSEVIKGIIRKIYRRHPHVFGNKTLNNSNEILTSWEEIKKEERRLKKEDSESIFSHIPKILPSLHYAFEIQNRASRLGFDWDNMDGIFDKIREETAELQEEFFCLKQQNLENDQREGSLKSNSGLKEEIGDVLFSIVNLSRHLGIDSEESLKASSKKFILRFDAMEKLAKERNIDFKKLALDEKEKLWQEVKLHEK